VRHLIALRLLLLSLVWLLCVPSVADEVQYPRYKASSRSPEALNILSNAYGGSVSAPDALEIGARVPDFVLPRAGGGEVSLAALRANGPVALIFYRGHW